MSNPIFKESKSVIGMVHLAALPGTPANARSISEILDQAVLEAGIYRESGVDGIMIENMHDVPYLRGSVGPEIVAAMSIIAKAVKDASALPVGVQVLAAANREALAVAHSAGLDFIRAEGYVFAHVADEGWIESSAAELLRYRRQIGADGIQVWADIKKKHSSHAITNDISLAATAEAVEFMRGDACIVTGGITGEPPTVSDVIAVTSNCNLPVYIGSGVTHENIADFLPHADGFIVGSWFKEDGRWDRAVARHRVERLMELLRGFRATA
jgi:uncharacterized protein